MMTKIQWSVLVSLQNRDNIFKDLTLMQKNILIKTFIL